MKINEVTPVLRTTREMYRRWRDIVAQVVVVMDPEKFLQVTTRNESDVAHFLDQAESTLQYNRWAKQGESSLGPWLDINIADEKIVGHEGRHRAASLINKGGKKMLVGFVMRDLPEGDYRMKYDIGWDDIPNVLLGQYGRGTLLKDRDYKLHKVLWQPGDGDKY